MSEFEDKLGAILSNPEAMNQIMALAQSIGGGSKKESPSPADSPQTPAISAPPPPAESSSGSGDLFSALGNLDPRFMNMAISLMSEYRSNNDDRAALLNALRPFVKPERYAKLDKAIQISRYTRIIRIALESFKTKGEGDGHV